MVGEPKGADRLSTPFTAALVLLAGAVAFIAILFLRLKGERERADQAVADAGSLRAQLAMESDNVTLVTRLHEDTKARLEQVIILLKAEILALEQDVEACRNPDVVRARLQRLLSGSPERRAERPPR